MKTFFEQINDKDGQWRPVLNQPVRVEISNRTQAAYDAAISQFDVEHSARYRARDGMTFCNIFAWDVTLSMYAELPHWVDERTHAPSWPMATARETTANWLASNLISNPWGWDSCTEAHAVAMASHGHPAIAIYKNDNPSRAGHVAIVEPVQFGGVTEVAQAGLVNGRHVPITNAFGGREVKFYWHV